ncbi:MAG: hypothetical protein ACRD6X_19905, partial [Pyrinomonadaceae bacterium]
MNDSDVLITYEGCGCAGGQVTTVQSELVPRDDQPTVNARRTQKVYEDILGRQYKTEVLNWNGAVYTSAVNTYNGRDQIIQSRQYAGATTSTTYQDTTATFDGFGRLASSHKPEQRDSSNNLKYTTYNYNTDDSISSMTDARGAVTNYTYNSRGLPTLVAWDVGSTGVTDVTDVEFEYDNAGNRTQMTDGLGTVDYSYNSLSQLTSETREFDDTLADAPLANSSFKLEYTYALAGQLKSLKDPYGDQIDYVSDKAGRLSSVTGSTFGGVTTYANNPGYRAWGGLKHLEYGNAVKADITFDSALRPETYNLQKDGSDPVMQNSYEYYTDGRLKFVEDTNYPYEISIWDRSMKYDHQGRVVEGKSSGEASGQTVYNLEISLPYRQSYAYNAFNNMTVRNNIHWGETAVNGQSLDLEYAYTNNRVSGWYYDADGRVTSSGYPEVGEGYEYDAAGQLIRTYNGEDSDLHRYLDGTGREGKRDTDTCVPHPTQPEQPCTWHEKIEYFVRSTVLGGQVVSEVLADGKKNRTYVHAAGEVIAWQNLYGTTESVVFRQTDASGMSIKSTSTNGVAGGGNGYEGAPAELDPLGGNAGTESPYINPAGEPCLGCDILLPHESGRINPNEPTFILDGFEVSGAVIRNLLAFGNGTWETGASLQTLWHLGPDRNGEVNNAYLGAAFDWLLPFPSNVNDKKSKTICEIRNFVDLSDGLRDRLSA